MGTNGDYARRRQPLLQLLAEGKVMKGLAES
jgi:hypothetical protein